MTKSLQITKHTKNRDDDIIATGPTAVWTGPHCIKKRDNVSTFRLLMLRVKYNTP